RRENREAELRSIRQLGDAPSNLFDAGNTVGVHGDRETVSSDMPVAKALDGCWELMVSAFEPATSGVFVMHHRCAHDCRRDAAQRARLYGFYLLLRAKTRHNIDCAG